MRFGAYVTSAFLIFAQPVMGGVGPTAAPNPTDYTIDPVVHSDEVAAGPQRIISVAPSITEMCAALGLVDRIIGRTQYCTHPPAVQVAPIVGAHVDTNLEKIIALKPDIILITAGSKSKLGQKLDLLDLPYEILPDNDIAEIFRAIESLGRIVERPKTAAMLIRHLRDDLQRLQHSAGDHRGTKVLFILHPLPVRPGPVHAAGPGSHLDELLKLAGYSNALDGLLKNNWPRVSIETILSAKPDAILETWLPDESTEAMKIYRGWASLDAIPAIAKRQVRSLRGSSASKPGPRINIALHEIITALSGTE